MHNLIDFVMNYDRIVSDYSGYVRFGGTEVIMQYDNTNLPEDVKMYLREIHNDEELQDAFFNCDIEIYEMAVSGITVYPFFVIKATTDDYVDSEALVSDYNGQETLEKLRNSFSP